MPSFSEKLIEAARKRKAARDRPFPQFTLRTMLLVTSLCAIGLGLVRLFPVRLDAEESAFVGAVGACVVVAFVVGVVWQNRPLFAWGCVGGMIGANFAPPIYVNSGPPFPTFWERFCAQLLFTIVPVLVGTLVGFTLPGCLTRYETWRGRRWASSEEARVRHGAMPPTLDIPAGEERDGKPPDDGVNGPGSTSAE